MANKTLTITGPAELVDATVEAFAAMGSKDDESTSDEDHAIEMMLDDFRTKAVQHKKRIRDEAARIASREEAAANDAAMKAARDAITVTIESE